MISLFFFSSPRWEKKKSSPAPRRYSWPTLVINSSWLDNMLWVDLLAELRPGTVQPLFVPLVSYYSWDWVSPSEIRIPRSLSFSLNFSCPHAHPLPPPFGLRSHTQQPIYKCGLVKGRNTSWNWISAAVVFVSGRHVSARFPPLSRTVSVCSAAKNPSADLQMSLWQTATNIKLTYLCSVFLWFLRWQH